jgi:serine/threonine protein kinase
MAHATHEPAMSDPDLQRVEQMFQAAADLPAGERSAYLDRECGDAADLRAHVERLLGRLDDDASLTLPEAHPGLHGPLAAAAAITEGPGAVIGRYKLLQQIGEGGFGVVYMAEQQEPVVRKVALKIIKLGMDTREVVARFEAERQALAMMDHPNIARVLDGGATDSGRPYFVMELVRGVAITEYCEKNDLGTRDRLELFLQVCHAVQHAHQKGVIHRDLKPSNVMVTLHDGQAMPKVIDFGVAKAMHVRLTEKTLFTRYEQFIGTPAYMSPEQAEMSALDVDTRTDIYSLGVLLYELLTGSTPFDTTSLKQAGLAEIQRIIREEQPLRPSVRISTTATTGGGTETPVLSRLLRGDLDWIVMKAIEKERSRRYATASELAEDIHRHLRHEPVQAGPPGTTYRLRKFLARNRAVVVSGTLVAIALVVGIITTTSAMLSAHRHANTAQEQAEHALAALDFLMGTLSLTNPEVALNPEVSVLTLLRHTSERVAETFTDNPGAELRLRSTIGRAYSALSREELAESHLRRAVELADQFIADAPPGADPFAGSGFSAHEFYSTLWALTNVCFNTEKPDAFAVAQRARQVGVDHIGETHPEFAEDMRRFLQAIDDGAWWNAPDAMSTVPDLFRKTVEAGDAALPAGDPLWPIVADMYLTAGYQVWYTPHEPMGEMFWRQALEIQRRELPAQHPDVGTTVSMFVGILNLAGKFDEAESLARESIAQLKSVLPADAYPVAVAEAMLGRTLVARGGFAEAEPILKRSHEVILETVGSPSQFMAVESFVRLIELYEAWERPDEAEAYRASIARTGASGPYMSQWVIIRLTLTGEHAAMRAVGDRLDEMSGGISWLLKPGGVTTEGLAPVVAEFNRQFATLDPTSDRAAAIARIMLGWANSLEPVHHRSERASLAEAALPVMGEHEDELPLALAVAYALRADTAVAAGGVTDDSRRDALEAWRLAQQQLEGPEMWFVAAARCRIARTLLDHGLYEPAEMLLAPAHDQFQVQLGPDTHDGELTRGMLFDLYTATGRHEDAARYAAD